MHSRKIVYIQIVSTHSLGKGLSLDNTMVFLVAIWRPRIIQDGSIAAFERWCFRVDFRTTTYLYSIHVVVRLSSAFASWNKMYVISYEFNMLHDRTYITVATAAATEPRLLCCNIIVLMRLVVVLCFAATDKCKRTTTTEVSLNRLSLGCVTSSSHQTGFWM